MKKEPRGFGDRPIHIEGLQIPDSDLPGWLEELRNSKLTDEEIDEILMHLNQTYLREKMVKPAAQEILKEIEEHLAEKGQILDEDQRSYWRRGLEERLETEFRQSRGGKES